MNRTLNFNYSKLRMAAIFYAAVPIIIFFIGWLKWYISIPFILLLAAAVFMVKKEDNQKESGEYKLELSVKLLFILGLLAFVWSFLGGQGGYWFQTTDFDYRNAIFRDIIQIKWPVHYENIIVGGKKYDGALSYYICYWMVPALFGKLVLLVGGSSGLAWAVGNFILFLWTSMGLILFFLLFLVTLKLETPNQKIAACLMFVFFGGLDLIGSLLFEPPAYYHLEWWAGMYQYSSPTTCLFWAFNQTVISWMITLCVINEKNIKNYAFLGLLALPFGPFPFIGIFIICICLGVKRMVYFGRNKKWGIGFKEIFSIQNILAILCILPVFGLYYYTNAAITSTAIPNTATASANGGFRFYWEDYIGELSIIEEVLRWFCFIMLEFGIYMLCIYKEHKKDFLYYLTIIALMIIPLFRIGDAGDFAMRVSIPFIVIVSSMVIKSLIQYVSKQSSFKNGKMLIRYKILIYALIFGIFTPGLEFARGFIMVASQGQIGIVSDTVKTLEGSADGTNFYCVNPENTIFYRILCK